MKKGLALLLAASMSLSAFSSAFAAELTAQEKFDALKAKGIFEGYTDGTAGLDKEMTRAEFAMVLKRLMKLEEVKPATPTFKDLKTDAWYYGAIEAAVKAGYINGLPDGTFAPSANVTYEQLAKLLVGALNLEVDANATVEGTVSPKMAGYVKAAIDAGLITAQSNYKAAVKRDVLVSATYVADATINKPVVTFGAKAVGAKKIEVTFGTAVDTSKVAVTLKKGNTPINVAKTTFAEDKKSVVIETSTKLSKGDYTVTATGVAAEALTATVSVEDEKVAKIEFQSDKAALVRGNSKQIEIYYTITNQYGENINSSAEGQVTFTYTKGNPGATGSNGKLTLTSTADYALNETVTVYALHNSGTFAQQTFTVSPVAQVATVEIKGLYNKDGKTPVQGDSPSAYAVEVVAKDQYGRDISENLIDDDTIVTVTNPSVFNVASTFRKDGDKVLLDLEPPTANPAVTTLANAGKGTVLIMSKTTGNKAMLDIEVKEAKKVDTLTLSAPEIVVAGEKVEIPFTAVDKDGNTLGKAKDLGILDDVVLKATGLPDLTWSPDYVNDKVTLTLDATSATNTTAQPIFITGTTPSGKLVQLQVTIQPKATPVVVTGVEELKTAIAKEGKATIAANKVKVLDQYSRSKTLADFAGYVAKVTSSDPAKVSLAANAADGEEVILAGGSVDLYGRDAGSSSVTIELYKGTTAADAVAANLVANSEFSTNVRTVTVADITGYEVADVAKIYAGGVNYAKDLVINGLLADGTKVSVPNSTTYYTVTEGVYGLDYSAPGSNESKLVAVVATGNDIDAIDVGAEKNFAVTVIGNTKDGTTVVAKEVTVTRVAPVLTTLELTDNAANSIRKIGDNTAKVKLTAAQTLSAEDLANQLVTAKDQYGVTYTGKVVQTAVFSGKNATVAVQDTFKIVAVAPNGKSVTVTVTVVPDNNW